MVSWDQGVGLITLTDLVQSARLRRSSLLQLLHVPIQITSIQFTSFFYVKREKL